MRGCLLQERHLLVNQRQSSPAPKPTRKLTNGRAARIQQTQPKKIKSVEPLHILHGPLADGEAFSATTAHRQRREIEVEFANARAATAIE